MFLAASTFIAQILPATTWQWEIDYCCCFHNSFQTYSSSIKCNFSLALSLAFEINETKNKTTNHMINYTFFLSRYFHFALSLFQQFYCVIPAVASRLFRTISRSADSVSAFLFCEKRVYCNASAGTLYTSIVVMFVLSFPTSLLLLYFSTNSTR